MIAAAEYGESTKPWVCRVLRTCAIVWPAKSADHVPTQGDCSPGLAVSVTVPRITRTTVVFGPGVWIILNGDPGNGGLIVASSISSS